MTEPADNPYAPPPPGWQPPAAPPGWVPPPPPPPPYAAPPGWQPPPPPLPPYAAPPDWQPPPPQYAAAPGGYPAYGYSGYGYPQPKSTNGFAIASLACSIVLGLVPFLGAGLGVTFGIIALRQCARSNERGRGLAIAGLVIGGLALVYSILAVVGLAMDSHSTTNSPGLGAVIY